MAITLNGTTGITTPDVNTDDLSVDTNTLFVDAANNRVGVGTTAPAQKLEVHGNIAQRGDNTRLNSLANDGTLICEQGNGSLTGDPLTYGITTRGAFPLLLGTNSAERARIDASGNLLVGTTSQIRPSTNPSVQIASAGGEQIIIRHTGAVAGRFWRTAVDNNNTIYVINQDTIGVYIGNGGNSWLSLSDERHKDIIEPITNAAEKLASLRPVIGKYKVDEEGKRRSFLIAQDVQAVLPEAVYAEDPDRLGLSYTDTIPLLVAALQEALTKISQLEIRIAALEGGA